MKVERDSEKKFIPVVITLETEKELDNLINDLRNITTKWETTSDLFNELRLKRAM